VERQRTRARPFHRIALEEDTLSLVVVYDSRANPSPGTSAKTYHLSGGCLACGLMPPIARLHPRGFFHEGAPVVFHLCEECVRIADVVLGEEPLPHERRWIAPEVTQLLARLAEKLEAAFNDQSRWHVAFAKRSG